MPTALICVDLQEDFCPPHGPLAIAGGRDLAPLINRLLAMPFALKVATQDWHPPDHVSFAANHPSPDNQPFVSVANVTNPADPSESEVVKLWPVHCVQDTKGAELIPELDTSKLDAVVQKGQDKRIEMFSAFRDSYKTCVARSRLSTMLHDARIDKVYCVGLAFDHCVKETAVHAAADGYATFIVEEGTRGVNYTPEGTAETRSVLASKGVQVVSYKDIVI